MVFKSVTQEKELLTLYRVQRVSTVGDQLSSTSFREREVHKALPPTHSYSLFPGQYKGRTRDVAEDTRAMQFVEGLRSMERRVGHLLAVKLRARSLRLAQATVELYMEIHYSTVFIFLGLKISLIKTFKTKLKTYGWEPAGNNIPSADGWKNENLGFSGQIICSANSFGNTPLCCQNRSKIAVEGSHGGGWRAGVEQGLRGTTNTCIPSGYFKWSPMYAQASYLIV